jgi:hypothetical protein
MKRERELKALVVYESFFGNTESIARAVASGLRLEGLDAIDRDVSDVHDLMPGGYDLLVAGGPTHAFALSRPRTRDDAVARGGDSSYSGRGLREWLSDIPNQSGTRLAAAFDTRVSTVRRLPMSAARSAAHLLRQRGFTLVARPAGFVVLDVEGPLEQSELERAVTWGRTVGCAAQDRMAAGEERGQRWGS